MKAEALPIGAVIGEKRRFEVPICQRTYVWTDGKQLPKCFQHIARKSRALLNGHRPDLAHCMGALIVQPEGSFSIGRVPTFLVIDGQQRLTTFQVFLAVLRELARDRGLETVRNQLLGYVLNEGEHLMADPLKERYKLQPTGFARGLFRDLVDRELPDIGRRYPTFYYQNNWVAHWPRSDGRKAPTDFSAPTDDAMRTAIEERDRLKHTLGNLTLLTPAENPSISKGPYVGQPGGNKRERLRGSLLKLNHEIANNDQRLGNACEDGLAAAANVANRYRGGDGGGVRTP